MSGHSKWSKVKHQKEATDAVKGKIFTKMASAIIIAVRECGGIADPDSNFRLRLAIEKARAHNMPKENIERAIEKGAGKGEGTNLERVVYEAFGPGKVGLIIDATTDNHQRTTAEIKNILERTGGVLAAQGAVSYLFSYVGMLKVKKDSRTYDNMMSIVIEGGGEDLIEEEDNYTIYTTPHDLHMVKINIEKKGITVNNAELIYKPVVKVTISPADKNILYRLIEALEENSDVQKVFVNLDE